ncbi:MAG: hypothetical protein HY698_04310 [Deltaproteobacteria bacterium]|nr:hypothetical protein [Deltaproteobacteria bacterium]
MEEVAAPEHRVAAARVRELMALYERNRDLIALGAYRLGQDREVDVAVARIESITRFLWQGLGETSTLGETVVALRGVAG